MNGPQSNWIFMKSLANQVKSIFGANERILSQLPPEMVDAYRAGNVSALLSLAEANDLNIPELREAQLHMEYRRSGSPGHGWGSPESIEDMEE